MNVSSMVDVCCALMAPSGSICFSKNRKNEVSFFPPILDFGKFSIARHFLLVRALPKKKRNYIHNSHHGELFWSKDPRKDTP